MLDELELCRIAPRRQPLRLLHDLRHLGKAVDDIGLDFCCGQVWNCLAQADFCRSDLCCTHVTLIKRVILQAIQKLTGFYFGTGFFIVPDFEISGGHGSFVLCCFLGFALRLLVLAI